MLYTSEGNEPIPAKVIYSRVWDEYQVRLPGQNPYHTSDLVDAWDTARAMTGCDPLLSRSIGKAARASLTHELTSREAVSNA